MNVFELPFTAQPQRVTIRLVGVQYVFRLSWNTPANCWIMDMAGITGNKIVSGIPLVTGCDLLAQLEYLNIGGMMFVLSDQQPPDAVPTFDDLGSTGHVYFAIP